MSALVDVAKLAKLCGMFSSDHIGERASAAAMADRLVRDAGLTWHDVIRPVRPSIDAKLELLREHLGVFTDWERNFIVGCAGFEELSDKQLAVIDRLVLKARAYAEANHV
jgi:hypothetical protein